jgi:putative NADH-flavin reductase
MKIAVVGASGWLGGTVAREALERGHEVTAIGRNQDKLAEVEGATPLVLDATDQSALTEAVGGHDAVVVALTDRSSDDRSMIPAAARAAMEAVSSTDAGKLVYIGGGGSLNAPDGTRLVDSPDFPAAYKAEALAGAEALDAFREEAPENLDWAFLSPPPHDLHPGDKQGSYRVQGGDDPLGDPPDYAGISSGDLASAILDEIEQPQFARQRFTVGY